MSLSDSNAYSDISITATLLDLSFEMVLMSSALPVWPRLLSIPTVMNGWPSQPHSVQGIKSLYAWPNHVQATIYILTTRLCALPPPYHPPRRESLILSVAPGMYNSLCRSLSWRKCFISSLGRSNAKLFCGFWTTSSGEGGWMGKYFYYWDRHQVYRNFANIREGLFPRWESLQQKIQQILLWMMCEIWHIWIGSHVRTAFIARSWSVPVDWRRKVTIQPFRAEIDNVIALYLTPNSPRELNLSEKDRIACVSDIHYL